MYHGIHQTQLILTLLQWLTKGRNSCPLCRAEGVHETEKKSEPAPVDSAAPTPEIPSSNIIPAI